MLWCSSGVRPSCERGWGHLGRTRRPRGWCRALRASHLALRRRGQPHHVPRREAQQRAAEKRRGHVVRLVDDDAAKLVEHVLLVGPLRDGLHHADDDVRLGVDHVLLYPPARCAREELLDALLPLLDQEALVHEHERAPPQPMGNVERADRLAVAARQHQQRAVRRAEQLREGRVDGLLLRRVEGPAELALQRFAQHRVQRRRRAPPRVAVEPGHLQRDTVVDEDVKGGRWDAAEAAVERRHVQLALHDAELLAAQPGERHVVACPHARAVDPPVSGSRILGGERGARAVCQQKRQERALPRHQDGAAALRACRCIVTVFFSKQRPLS